MATIIILIAQPLRGGHSLNNSNNLLILQWVFVVENE